MKPMIQPTKLDKGKSQKPESVKHVNFATDKVKETTTPPKYNKPKPPALRSGSEPTKASSS